MTLRYQIELSRMADQPCPCPTNFRPRQSVAFRFMNRAATEADFVPPSIKGGIRHHTCNTYALSFFSSLENAKAKFRSLNKRVDAVSRYGGFIGEIELLQTDGVASDFDTETGHLDLHQNVGVTFFERVSNYFNAMEPIRNNL